jgi:hypothetical protein
MGRAKIDVGGWQGDLVASGATAAALHNGSGAKRRKSRGATQTAGPAVSFHIISYHGGALEGS